MPQAVKMDLRAFWHVLAMVSGLAACLVIWFDCIAVMLYVIYNNGFARSPHQKPAQNLPQISKISEMKFSL